MLSNNPRNLVLVALLQFVAVILLPPQTLAGMTLPVALAVVVLFAVLGIALLRHRPWSRVATIFVQGMNIIVRLLIGIGGAVQGGELQVWMLGTSLVSMAVSGLVLYYVDQPEVQMLMQ